MDKRYNTGNPRPSSSMKDLNDNALAYDDFLNSESDTFIDRFGNAQDTIIGATKKMAAATDAVIDEARQNLIPLSRQYMTLAAAQADIANIPVGSTTYYRSPDDSALAIEVINNGGTLEPTGRKMPSQTEVDQVRVQIMTLLNSMFRTSGLPSGWDVLLGINKLGQYAGGIDSTGALNFGKMISVLSEIATANIQNLNAGNIITTGGAKITGVAPDGFDFAFFNKLMQVGVGIKNDGSLAAGKIEAFYADIGRLVSDVIFNGGVKTTGILPEGFQWGWTDEYGRVTHGGKKDGSVESGTIKVKRLIADSIESNSLPADKKPVVKRLNSCA